MAEIKILNKIFRHEVAQGVIDKAEHTAKERYVTISQQCDGHIVLMDGPGDPSVATGDVMFIADCT